MINVNKFETAITKPILDIEQNNQYYLPKSLPKFNVRQSRMNLTENRRDSASNAK
jgi:hypothetical protein